MQDAGHCCHDTALEDQGLPPVGRKLKILGTLFLTVLALSFTPSLQALNDSLLTYLGIIWWAVLLGLMLGGSSTISCRTASSSASMAASTN